MVGSVGKTSTKEMLRIALEDQGKIYVSQGNFNNHYGLPLCLANMPEDTDYAVLEMGMSSVGEIAHLARMSKPELLGERRGAAARRVTRAMTAYPYEVAGTGRLCTCLWCTWCHVWDGAFFIT